MVFCGACGEENPARFRLCGFCGTPLRGEEPAPAAVEPEEERKPVTALFVDIVGSTSRGEELDPEDVLALLGPYYARVRAALEQHGGTVEKFIGDAVVGLFGAPVAHEDDPERAVRASLAILDAIAALNADDPSRRLQVRIGITTGEALVALGARVDAGQGMAWGDVMNTAARIQSAAPPGGILVDERTYAGAVRSIEFETAEAITAKGKAAPVPVWLVLGPRETVPEADDGASPFVGRVDELCELMAAWDGVASTRRAAVASLLGPPGAGKSRLVVELRRRVPDAQVHRGRCLSYGEGITYWPMVEIVRAAAGIRERDDAAAVAERLAALLDGLPTSDLDELRTIAAAVSNLVGAPLTPRGTYAAAEISEPELHWGIRRLLELLARARPMLLVLEDVHWAEESLVRLVDSMGSADAPILVLLTARPEVADAWPRLAHAADGRTVLRLEPLDDGDSRRLAAQLLGDATTPATIERLVRNAGGNPLFLEETARMLAESGGVDPDADGGTSLPLPSSLQGLVGARLDALPAAEKRVAQRASVIGLDFWSGAVGHLSDGSGHDRELERLAVRDIVRELLPSSLVGEREWSFKHAVIRDVAYARLPKGMRAALHLRFAEWLRQVAGADEDLVEILAYHFEQATRLARDVSTSPVAPPVREAVDALRRAAERAERREGIREARRYYERALAVAGPDDAETRLELEVRQALTLISLGELAPAAGTLSLAAEEALALGRLDLRCEALIGLANIDLRRGSGAEALRGVDEAQALADRLDNPALRVRAAYEAATAIADFAGDPHAAARKLEDGLAVAAETGDRSLQIEGHMRLGAILFNAGDLARADHHLALCLELAATTGSLREQARATCFAAYVAYEYRGDPPGAERLAQQAMTWLERTGDTLFVLQTLMLVARLALARGDVEEAEELLRRALPIALESVPLANAELHRLFVEALLRQGRVADARDLARFAARSTPDADTPWAHARFGEAFVAAAERDLPASARAYADGVVRLREAHAWPDLIACRMAFARVAEWLGDREGAAAELRHARGDCARVDAAGLAALIDRELRRLDAELEASAVAS